MTYDNSPLVPFVPFSCPDCKQHKPRTHRQQGKIRYHQCGHCGTRYRSIQLAPEDVMELIPEPPESPPLA